MDDFIHTDEILTSLESQRKQFSELMRKAYSSSSKMADAFAEKGLVVSRSTCAAWRSGDHEPSPSLGMVATQITLATLKERTDELQSRIDLASRILRSSS
ncbi:hypothetical protein ACFFUB_06725 [Algimonas porphyrae]|uniref:hypothetical protein n=1 Tax=Algimonas porphyrae TaxID=1128113 RepID=UPI0024E05412|nr:hypothetical protein [Algimonas porphyrae]